MSGTEPSPDEQNADAADERRDALEIWLFFILVAAVLAVITLTRPGLSDAAVTHAVHIAHTFSHR